MKEINIKNLKYEDFINPDNIYGFIVSIYCKSKNPFTVIENSENALKLSTELNNSDDYYSIEKLILIDDINTLKDELQNNFSDEKDISHHCFLHKNILSKEEFNNTKESSLYVNFLFDKFNKDDLVIKKNFEKYYDLIKENFFSDEFIVLCSMINKLYDHLLDILAIIDYEEDFIYTHKEDIKDYQKKVKKFSERHTSFIKKLNNTFIDDKRIDMIGLMDEELCALNSLINNVANLEFQIFHKEN